jgi:Zn-dependent protease
MDSEFGYRLNVFIFVVNNSYQICDTAMAERQKFYTSFHDLSPREYMYIPKGNLEVGKPGSFSRIEVGHLLIAIGILTFAFSFTFSKNNLVFFLLGMPIDVFAYVVFIPIAFLGIVTAFVIHELAHKFVAQKYGLWSEFRMYPRGLVVSVVLAFFTGLVFAAPGAVMFRGDAKPSEAGRISAAGASANLSIAVVAYILYYFVFVNIEFWGTLVGFICLVNLLLATFNLLPFGPLDGKKVLLWNEIVWLVLFSVAVLFLSGMFIGGNLLMKFFT